MARGGGGGDYSREAINRGTAIIRGNTVFGLNLLVLQNFLLPARMEAHVYFYFTYNRTTFRLDFRRSLESGQEEESGL